MEIVKCDNCFKESNMIVSEKDSNGNFYFFCKKCFKLYNVSHNKFGMTNVQAVDPEEFNGAEEILTKKIGLLFENNGVYIDGLCTNKYGVFVYIKDINNKSSDDKEKSLELINNFFEETLDKLDIKNPALRKALRDKFQEKANDSYDELKKEELKDNNYLLELRLPFKYECVRISNKEDLVALLSRKPEDLPVKVFKVKEVPLTEFK